MPGFSKAAVCFIATFFFFFFFLNKFIVRKLTHLGVNKEVEDSRALNTILLLVKSFIMNCKYDKCVLSTASLARKFKEKVTLLSKVFDQDVLVQLAMMF